MTTHHCTILTLVFGCCLYSNVIAKDIVEHVTINTSLGQLQGKVHHTKDVGAVSQFLGIPYADPPLGPLRFRPPSPFSGWNNNLGVYDATDFGPSCPQDDSLHTGFLGDWLYETYIKDLQYSEDCLYLNVYVPGDLRRGRPEDKLPVMAWIYGGGFQFGTSSFKLYEGDQLALDGNVIVVSMNYRTGPLGFLTTGDENALGNYGLLDQTLALRWIRENIADFGGDPDNVMIFGESSGATSVSHHLLSPASQGLFQKAAAQSGNHGQSSFSVITLEEAAPASFAMAGLFNCSTEDVANMLDCLRAIPVDDIINAPGLRFSPVIDGEFIPDDPRYLFETGQFTKVPYMIGTTSEDGTVALADKSIFERGVSDVEAIIFVQIAVLVSGYTRNQEELVEAILEEYFASASSDPFLNLRSTLDMLRDQLFLAPHLRMLQDQMNWGGTCYSYYHVARPDFRPKYQNIEVGASHGDDLFFVFGALGDDGFMADNNTQVENTLTQSMMRAWTSFANTGEPYFLDKENNSHVWPAHEVDGTSYLEFDYNMTKDNIRQGLFPRVNQFWNEIIPAIGEAKK